MPLSAPIQLIYKPISTECLNTILKEYQHSRQWSKSCGRVVIFILSLLFSLFFLNITVGIILYYLELSHHIFWHSVSVFVILLYLLFFAIQLLYGYERLYHQQGLAEQLFAQKIDCQRHNLTIQECYLYQINQDVARQFSVEAVDLFLLQDASINSFTWHLKQQQPQIFLTWGMLYHFNHQELYQIILTHYILILSGEAKERSLYYLYLQGYISSVVYANRTIVQEVKNLRHAYHVLSLLKLLNSTLIKALGFFDVTMYRITQYYLFHRDERIDYYIAKHNAGYIHVLLRVALYPHLFSVQRMDFRHLSPLAFLLPTQYWWCSPKRLLNRRLQGLGVEGMEVSYADIQRNIYKYRRQPLQGIRAVYGQSFTLHQKLLKFNYQKNTIQWQSTALPAQMSLTFNAQNRQMDQIRPLNPQLRQQKAHACLQKIFPTTSHYIHVLSCVLELRKLNNPQLVQLIDISATVMVELYKIDQRLLLEIFEQCCNELKLPLVLAQSHLSTWAKIIQNDNTIHILDALMLERAKAHWQLLPSSRPQLLSDVIEVVAQLLQAILYIQPFSVPEDIYRMACYYVFGEHYPAMIDKSQYVDYADVFRKLAGLNMQDKLTILVLVEYFLWYHGKITQDAFDVLVLLYWRLGFNHHEVKAKLYKRSQIAIW